MQVLIDNSNAYKALVFRINDGTDFTINGLAYCATEYEHDRKPSELHPRPYFRPEFTGPIGKAMAEKRMRLVHPEGEVNELAIRHLQIP